MGSTRGLRGLVGCVGEFWGSRWSRQGVVEVWEGLAGSGVLVGSAGRLRGMGGLFPPPPRTRSYFSPLLPHPHQNLLP